MATLENLFRRVRADKMGWTFFCGAASLGAWLFGAPELIGAIGAFWLCFLPFSFFSFGGEEKDETAELARPSPPARPKTWAPAPLYSGRIKLDADGKKIKTPPEIWAEKLEDVARSADHEFEKIRDR